MLWRETWGWGAWLVMLLSIVAFSALVLWLLLNSRERAR